MFTAPWTLLALFSVPVVVGIYLFRTRTRRREVSSLFLWSDQSQSRQGGRRLEKIQLPLLLFLELLALLLLCVAAAGPHIKTNYAGRPTVIILDDSYSMLAEVQESDATLQSVRDRAEQFLHRFLDHEAGYPVQFVLAGVNGSLLSSRVENAVEAKTVLKEWKCESPTASIDSAISLASRTALSGAKILIITDHAPEGEISAGQIRWNAFGHPQPNLSIVHANRTFHAGKDRLLVEIANLGTAETRLNMSIFDTLHNRVLQRIDQPIAAEEVLNFRLSLSQEGTGSESAGENFPVEIRLNEDALGIDNRFTLLPVVRRPVRVSLDGVPGDLVGALKKAISASAIAEVVESDPELIFCGPDTGEVLGENSASEKNRGFKQSWKVRFYGASGAGAQSFAGPFVVDRAHSLTHGLSLDGVVWSGSPELSVGGYPIISAGNTPLLTEQIHRDGTRDIRIQLNERLSTLTISPAWPILVWNILKSRRDELHGIAENNLRLGSEAVFIAAKNDQTLELKTPSGKTQSMELRGSRTAIPAREVGVYQVKTQSGTYDFSVGTLSREESNLLFQESGTFGSWTDEETIRSDYRGIAWILLLLVLTVLTFHLFLTSRSFARSG